MTIIEGYVSFDRATIGGTASFERATIMGSSWFSGVTIKRVVTAATPGYGGYHPKAGIFQGVASFEAIFGTFMWAAFIATFARKYMR